MSAAAKNTRDNQTFATWCQLIEPNIVNFEEKLNAISDSLEHEGRIAYRMLKRRYDLDDEDIEDLKSELIDAKRIATDDDGKVLVWAGNKSTPVNSELPDTADRRLLTVMFCDVVDSTALSEQFDAEDLREIIHEYQQICTTVIERFEGHVAQLLGDGLLVYFGYPIAQEDEAYQAVRSGLEILQALRDADSLITRIGSPLRVRIGIHSGPVVVGAMGSVGRQEHLALGDTPNIAARVQSAARPDELLISEATHRLVEGLFKIEQLGPQVLKGVTRTFDLFRVHSELSATARFEVALSTGRLTHFVGRENELSLIAQDWEQAKNSVGRVILLNADPGMGKTRLMQEFAARYVGEHFRRVTIRCSPYHRSSPLYPIIQVCQRAFMFASDDSAAEKVAKIERALARYEFSDADAAGLIADMMSVKSTEAAEHTSTPKRNRREALFGVLIEWFIQESTHVPVFAIWDDLHWADPSTLELLSGYLERVPSAATLTVLLYRSNFVAPWKARAYFRYLSLNRLEHADVDQLVNEISAPQQMPSTIMEHIQQKTDGIPLYVEEVTRSIVDSNILEDIKNQKAEPASIAIPMTLQDSLEARIDNCPNGKIIAQWGASLGREFSYGVLRRVVEDDLLVKSGIAELLDAELIYRSGSPSAPTFIFKHALLRDTAYESLLVRKRRHYHRRIAEIIAAEFPRINEDQPEVVAYHYAEGECFDDALACWYRAGVRSNERSAYLEAAGHLQQGLDLLQDLSRSKARAIQELNIQLLRGTIIVATQGNTVPEIESIYRRALDLCDEIGDDADRTPAYFGLRSFYLTRADLAASQEVSLALYDSAIKVENEDSLLEANVALANNYYFLGDFESLERHGLAALAIYDQKTHSKHVAIYGTDPGVVAHTRVGFAACWRGATSSMSKHFDQALKIARDIDHPYSRCHVIGQIAWAHQWRGEHEHLSELLAEATAIAEQHEFPFYLIVLSAFSGFDRVHAGDMQAGIEAIITARQQLERLNSPLLIPILTALEAEAYGHANNPEAGLAILPQAFAFIERTNARYAEAYLYHVKGELLGQARLVSEAENAFVDGLDLANQRGMFGQALKTSIALRALRQRNGNKADDLSDLRAVVNRIGSNEHSPDMHVASGLLA